MHNIAQKQKFFFLTTRAGSGSGFGGELSGSRSGKKVQIRPDPDSDPQHCHKGWDRVGWKWANPHGLLHPKVCCARDQTLKAAGLAACFMPTPPLYQGGWVEKRPQYCFTRILLLNRNHFSPTTMCSPPTALYFKFPKYTNSAVWPREK